MKFIPSDETPVKPVHRIYWDHGKGSYIYSNLGKTKGMLLVDAFTAQELVCGNFESLPKELGEVMVTDPSGVTDKVTSNHVVQLHLNTNESENQLPYGTFRLLERSYSGEMYIKPYNSTIVESNIIENKNLKQQVFDFFNGTKTERKNKKGFLLFGAPGNGKTTEIMELFKYAQEEKIRFFLVGKNVSLWSLSGFQSLLENERTVFIFEEITERIGPRGTEELLTFLDGENSWNNSITIATTNHPEELPANLVDRPGRFDTFIEYTNPRNKEVIKLANLFGYNEDEVSCLLGGRLSFDYVSFILSQAKKLGKSVKETKEYEEEKRKKLSQTFKGKIGIGE